jgi:RNA polymerase sigma-54 factor
MMNFEQVAVAIPDQGLALSAKVIESIKILQYSAEELEQSIAHEVDQNPALEVDELEQCLRCGATLHAGVCLSCDMATDESLAILAANLDNAYEFERRHDDLAADGGESDPLEFIRAEDSLPEYLLRQLGVLLPEDDQPIAEYLVGNLDSHGYLTVSVTESAEALRVSEAQVESVLRTLQSLDPPGIGARDLQECLLIQLAGIEQNGATPSLARPLLEGHLTALGEHHFAEIGHDLGVTSAEVEAAWRFIRSNLNPYPAHAFESDEVQSPGLGSVAERSIVVRPDVVIVRIDDKFEAEVIERRRYRFAVNTIYQSLYRRCRARSKSAWGGLSTEERQHVRQYAARARFFMDCVSQRWDTLLRITEALIDQQNEFLENGVRFLKPLTRGELASSVGLHESTVSRATANKYVLLPCGRTVPFDDFFDGSLAVKDALRELIATEDTRKPSSDAELTRRLSERGISIARRTVAKYRDALGIMPSRFRI